ncbi:hypothetical protein Hanom_Chr00s000004g01609831 [Helianthus anomalus]
MVGKVFFTTINGYNVETSTFLEFHMLVYHDVIDSSTHFLSFFWMVI